MSYDWDVSRTTTEKLADELNDIDWDVHQIQYIGGRDWIIISRQSVINPDIFRGVARRNEDNTLWEITIPSVGPNDEPLIVNALQTEWINAIAEEAIASHLNIPTSDVQVDISVDTRVPKP